MRHFLTLANKRTLFLIDEFGTGTEPGLGGAIAEAILENLTKSGAFGVINTHYTNLKVLADKMDGLVNGAMRFDGEHLEPFISLKSEGRAVHLHLKSLPKSGYRMPSFVRAKEKLGTSRLVLKNC
jgi:DNA mismatch repair protein MutS2